MSLTQPSEKSGGVTNRMASLEDSSFLKILLLKRVVASVKNERDKFNILL